MEKDGLGQSKSTLFVEENTEHSILWSGPLCGVHNAKTHFCIDKSFSNREFTDWFRNIQDKCTLFVDFNENDCLKDGTRKLLEAKKPRKLREILHRMRLTKSDAEQLVMKRAGLIGAEAFRETIRSSRKNQHESFLAAKMEFEARLRGATGLAYIPVVAGGDRANIIHYVRNDRPLSEASLVLMDAGAKVDAYCNDITRTWPVSGRFTVAQKEMYQAVLRVQKQCIRALAQWPKFPELSISALNEIATLLFIDELGRLGVVNPKGVVDKLFPHSIGHFIGMDLHDCPTVSYDEPFREGMVITIEPGLYIPADPRYPERFHGIGIRIEDDLLLTGDGCINLTETVPRETEELEDLLNS